MRRLTTIAALLGLSVACFTTDEEPDEQGVQIGSEGVVQSDCETQALAGGATPPGFGESANAVADLLLGDLGASLDTGSEQITGTLSLQADSFATYDDASCGEELLMRVSADLDLGSALSADLRGWLAVANTLDGPLALRAPSWSGELAPAFDPNDFDGTVLRLDGSVDESGLSGVLRFEGCVAEDCTTSEVGDLDGTPPQ
jgi:hypothetical protein